MTTRNITPTSDIKVRSLPPAKITIVTFCWPPRNAIGTHRPYSWAKYWSELGAQVTVLTAEKYAYDEPLDLQLPILPGVEVIHVPYASGLTGAVSLLARSPFASILKIIYRSIRSQNRIHINPRSRWRQAAKDFVGKVAHGTDILVSTYDPPESHLIAYDIKRANDKIFWNADYRDLWSHNHAEAEGRGRIEEEMSSVGKYADSLTTVSDQLAATLSELHGRNAFVITNGHDLSREQVKSNLNVRKEGREGPIRIVYTGRIYESFQNPEGLFAAIRKLIDDGHLVPESISVQFFGNHESLAKKYPPDHTSRSFIRLMGYVPYESAIKAQQSADILILLASSQPRYDGVLTGKVFEYIASGTPVLAIGSRPGSSIDSLLRKTGTGMCVENNLESIAPIITSLKDRRKPSWYHPDLEAIMEFSRKEQAGIMYRKMMSEIL